MLGPWTVYVGRCARKLTILRQRAHASFVSLSTSPVPVLDRASVFLLPLWQVLVLVEGRQAFFGSASKAAKILSR